MKLVPTRISQGVTRNIGRTILKSKKNSPHIFFGVGIIGVVSGTVLACRATLKLEETIDEIKKDVDHLNHLTDVAEKNSISFDENDRRKELGHIGIKGAVKIGKLYGPAVVVSGVGIAALTGSHIQMTRRNAALTSAFVAVTKAYDDYRERVREEIGEDRELEIYRGMVDVEVEGENGKKKFVRAVNPDGLSIYARIFDETSVNWKKDPEHNRIFVQLTQNYFNHLLRSRGHVFLNEIYDHLGFERTGAGQVVGWVLNGDGDGYIDFGLFEAHNSRFINAIERSIVLDFNVDGTIFDKI